MDYVIGIVSGLIAAVIAWCLMMLFTAQVRNELKTAAEIELDEIRSQEGYNSIPLFGRRDRQSFSGDNFNRELKGTAPGEELDKIRRRIRIISWVILVVVTIIVIVIRKDVIKIG